MDQRRRSFRCVGRCRQRGIEVMLITTDDECSERVLTDVPAMFFPSQLGASFKYSRPLAVWLAANVEEFDLAHIHASL